MTNQKMLDDLRQYLDLKLDTLESRPDNKLSSSIDRLETRLKNHTEEVVTERAETILDALGSSAENVDIRLQNHENRITKLELATS